MLLSSGMLALLLLICMVGIVIVMAVFSYIYIEEIENYLSGCRCVDETKAVWGGGFIGRQMRMATVLIIIVFPKTMHRRGDVVKNANHQIPKKFRMWVLWQYIVLYLIFGCMVAFYFFMGGIS
ncbi:hypothetical protein ACIPL1_15015 [Pseudomonas sp. NPDC090202]|uniref:hypothetical protein n=1 Tax=unclassified Pseudomonas TaxID=196821 RepID=UPI0037F6B242